jgi:phosphatidylinositol alpha-1,6-mannosyltransferase
MASRRRRFPPVRHLLVTNDFPPKVGGIQSYLWELWRRLPAADVCVLTTPYAGTAEFDAAAGFRIERTRQPVLLPEPWLRHQIRALADEFEADLVILDPVLPLGALGPTLGRPYAVVLHGAEIAVPGRIPGPNLAMRAVLRGARLAISAGGYPLAEAERCAGRPLPNVVIPPGVDTQRFVPLEPAARAAARERFGLDPASRLVLSVSRLVPRKGMDTLVQAAALLAPLRPDLEVAIAGAGREGARLERIARRSGAPVRFLGRVDDDDLPDLYGAADVFAMLCRDRWWGLEQEGFGIVFLEAAAAGVAQVAGRSGGSHEAVVDGATGLVVDHPADADEVAVALARLLDDRSTRESMAAAARVRAVEVFDYDRLASALAAALDQVEVGAR